MKENKFKASFFLVDLIEIVENHEINFSKGFCLMCHLLHFLQILSFLIKAENVDYSEPKLYFFAKILYYANFVNFCDFFQSNLLNFLVFYAFQAWIYGIFCVLFTIFLIKRFFHWKFLRKTRFLQVFFKGVVFFISVFHWILLVPFLSIFAAFVDADSISVKILAIFAIFSTIFVTFLFIWLNRAHNFLEKNFLRISGIPLEFLAISLEISLAILFEFFTNFADFLVFAIGILWLFITVHKGLFSDQKIHAFFLCFLVEFLTITSCFLMKSSTNLLSERNFFYTMLISSVFTEKIALKLLEKHKKKLESCADGNAGKVAEKNSQNACFLENFYQYFLNSQTSEKCAFFFSGLLKNHVFHCKTPNCVLTPSKLLAFSSQKPLEQSRLINAFISEMLIRALKDKTVEKSSEIEDLLLKYGSFITFRSLNPIKAFFELEHVFALNKNPSFYYTNVIKILKNSLKASILLYERTSKKGLSSEEDKNEIDVATFASLNKTKANLKEKLVEILKIRTEFFATFRDGFQGFDSMISAVNRLNSKTLCMISFLDEILRNSRANLLQRFLPLKLKSLVSCVVLNHLHEGIKLEDQLEKLRKHEDFMGRSTLTSSSFFENDVVLIKASFLTSSAGEILKESLTAKVARFFDYSIEEAKGLRKISQFMPKLHRIFHQKLVDFYINKPRTMKSVERNGLETFAVKRNGELFMVKIYTGHCFDYAGDFVFQAAIIKEKEEFNGFLFDKNGGFCGFSEIFMKSMKMMKNESFAKNGKNGNFAKNEKNENLDKNQNSAEFASIEEFSLLNAYNLMPNLKDIIEKNKGFLDNSLVKLRNINAYFYIPNNLPEILEILKTKAKEEEAFRSYNSSRSAKSSKNGENEKNEKNGENEKNEKNGENENNENNAKNAKNEKNEKKAFFKKTQTKESSSKSNSRFISKFFRTTNMSSDRQTQIQRRYLENNLTNYEILKDLIDRANCTKLKMNFDLLFYSHQFSTSESLQYAGFFLKKIAVFEENIENSQKLSQLEEEDPTFVQNSEIQSSFINMPVPFIPEFRESLVLEGVKEENNRIFTTEAEVFLETEKNEKNEFFRENEKNEVFRENEKNEVFLENGKNEKNEVFTEKNEKFKEKNFNTLLGKIKEKKREILSERTFTEENQMKPPDKQELFRPVISLNEISSNNLEKAKEDENSYDSGFKSSQSKEKKLRILQENAKNKTSNEKIYDFNDISSQNSSMSSLKKTFAIFNMMRQIQRNFPSVLYTVFFTRALEVVFIVIYCVVLLVLSRQYIYSYYEPLEAAVLNFSNLYNSFAVSTNIMIHSQIISNYTVFTDNLPVSFFTGNSGLATDNSSTLTGNSSIYSIFSSLAENSQYEQIFARNLKEDFERFKGILNDEREKQNQHQYQEFFKSSRINVTQMVDAEFQSIPLLQFLDSITLVMNDAKNLAITDVDIMESEYFITNFATFHKKIVELANLIWKEFDSTNARILVSIEVILILFVITLLLMKIFDFYKMEQFYQQLVKILNIFLRTNQNEAITEIIVTNQAIALLSDPFDRFLHVNFVEELITRKTVKIIEENNEKNVTKNDKNEKSEKNVKTAEILKNAKKAINYKTVRKSDKTRRNHMKPISRVPRLFFAFFSYILVFSFLFFTYFYWNLVNDEINTLIDTTNFFQNLYTLPGSLVLCKNLIFRDKLVKNQFSTQIDNARKVAELHELLLALTSDIKKTNILIPKYALPAEEVINNRFFSEIVQGDICEVLYMESFIDAQERSLCEKIYNGVFTKGLLAVSNEFANIDNYFRSALSPDSSDFTEILAEIEAESIAIDIVAISFIDRAMEIFYQKIEVYHKNAMFTEQNNLQIMMIVTTVFIGGGLVVGVWAYARFLKRVYRNVSLVLSLIPYERLMNDEQTVFLIKKFSKD